MQCQCQNWGALLQTIAVKWGGDKFMRYLGQVGPMHGKINLCGELSNMFSLHTAEEPRLGAGLAAFWAVREISSHSPGQFMWRKSAINQIVIAMKYFTWNYEIKYDSFNVSICINTGITLQISISSQVLTLPFIALNCIAMLECRNRQRVLKSYSSRRSRRSVVRCVGKPVILTNCRNHELVSVRRIFLLPINSRGVKPQLQHCL